jgi:hypothetical protein
MTRVPGPLMLNDTDLPVTWLVTVARACPVICCVTVPSGAVVDRTMYWLKSGKVMTASKPWQYCPAGRVTGVAVSGMRGSSARAGAAESTPSRIQDTTTTRKRGKTRFMRPPFEGALGPATTGAIVARDRSRILDRHATTRAWGGLQVREFAAWAYPADVAGIRGDARPLNRGFLPPWPASTTGSSGISYAPKPRIRVLTWLAIGADDGR